MESGYLLKLQEKEQLEQFTHHVIDYICERGEVNFIATYIKVLPAFILKETVESMADFIRAIQAAFTTKEEIVKKLESQSVPGNLAQIIASCIAARQHDLNVSSVRKITQISKAYLADFDWKVNVSWSSSKLSNLKEPRLMLQLSVKDPQQNKKDIIVELSRQELDQLIASLELANQARLRLKV